MGGYSMESTVGASIEEWDAARNDDNNQWKCEKHYM